MRAWTVSVLFLSFLVACGRDRSSGAAPAVDSSQMAPADTASAGAVSDTSRPTPRPDTASARADTATSALRQATPQKPAPKPAAAKPPVPKPAAPTQAKVSDTSPAAATPQGDTTATAPNPAASAPTTEASAPLRDQYHSAPLDTVSQEVYNGWKQFNLNCARCHGEDVQGTTIAPHLIVSLKPDGPVNTKEIFVQTVCAGRPEKGMPAWCALGMDMNKINQIYAYVKGRSDAKIHPGRPAVKAGG
jgi:hypothetical protein